MDHHLSLGFLSHVISPSHHDAIWHDVIKPGVPYQRPTWGASQLWTFKSFQNCEPNKLISLQRASLIYFIIAIVWTSTVVIHLKQTHNYEMSFCKSNGNHKAKTYSRYTKDKDKRIKNHTTTENHQITRKDSKRRRKEKWQ